MLDLTLMKGLSEGDINSDMPKNAMDSLWDSVLTEADMSGKFGTLFNTFWKPTKLISVKDNVYTIGDSYNDVEMIEKFNGYSIENAKEEVKKVSKGECSSVSKLIKKIIKGTSEISFFVSPFLC